MSGKAEPEPGTPIVFDDGDGLQTLICPLCRRALGTGMQVVLFSPAALAGYLTTIERHTLRDAMLEDPEQPVALCVPCGDKARRHSAHARAQ